MSFMKNDLLRKRGTCRLCDSRSLELVLSLPACPPVDAFCRESETASALPYFPMDLFLCLDCGHAQLLHVVRPDILFGNYIYTSSSSPDLDSHFDSYVVFLSERLGLRSRSKLVDIGSNDGLFLSKAQRFGASVLGVDASVSVSEVAEKRGVPTLVGFFDAAVADRILSDFGQADFVTANNVFSHSDDLRGFAKSALSLLKPDGIFVFEVSYLMSLVNDLVVDYIYHEHLAHHSVKPLVSFFDSIGGKLIDVIPVGTKGGSIRCVVAPKDSPHKVEDSVGAYIDRETKAGLYELGTYRRLNASFRSLINECVSVIDTLTENGEVLSSYGASATATVLNEFLGISGRLSFIVDDNPARQGLFSPGHAIPICDRDHLTAVGGISVISSWRFADMIIAKNQPFLLRGGCFFVPLPVPRIVTLEGSGG